MKDSDYQHMIDQTEGAFYGSARRRTVEAKQKIGRIVWGTRSGRKPRRGEAQSPALSPVAQGIVDANRTDISRWIDELDAEFDAMGGKRAPREVSMAKLHAVETAIAVCLTAMESMGAQGLSVEAGVERCWRDAVMLTAIDGTANVQRLIIGRETLGIAAFT